MSKQIVTTGIALLCISLSFGQLTTSATGRVNEIKTDFVFNFLDGQYNRPLIQSGWLNGVGDYISLKHGGNNTEANTYGFRISDAQGFDFGKSNFGTSFLKIRTDGNVGIGITNPIAKLDVKGDISATNKLGFSTNDAFDV